METNEQTFRRAAVGGFNREDVLKYIEASAKLAAQRIEALKAENAALSAAGTAAEAAERETAERLMELEAETARLNTVLTERNKSLYETQDALDSQRAETECLRAELDHLREKVSKVESGAAAYAELRDRTGTIELESHQRAMLIEQEARQKAELVKAKAQTDAERLRADAEHLAVSIQAEYGRLREDLERAVATASRDLMQVGKTLDNLGGIFVIHENAAQKLLDSCKKCPPERNKFLQPLPLDGEE